MEQEEVIGLHQDLMDYVYEKAALPNVHVVPERLAGEACRKGQLDHLLKGASEVSVLGGHLTGCLDKTIESMKQRAEGPNVNVVTELTFDDDENFWKRMSADDYFTSN